MHESTAGNGPEERVELWGLESLDSYSTAQTPVAVLAPDKAALRAKWCTRYIWGGKAYGEMVE